MVKLTGTSNFRSQGWSRFLTSWGTWDKNTNKIRRHPTQKRARAVAAKDPDKYVVSRFYSRWVLDMEGTFERFADLERRIRAIEESHGIPTLDN